MKHCEYSKPTYLNGEMTAHLCLRLKVILKKNFDFCNSCEFHSEKAKGRKVPVTKIIKGVT
jgi:hypothetical protein